MFTNIVSVTSRGNITLNSTSAFTHPVLSPNLLSTDFDIFNMREAVKSARRFMAAPAWSNWIVAEYGTFAQAQTDEEIDAYARAGTYTNSHGSCTVPMGKTGNDTSRGSGALNSDLTVKQTVGLRVVDSTIFVSPFTRTVKCVVMMMLITFVVASDPSGTYADTDVYRR